MQTVATGSDIEISWSSDRKEALMSFKEVAREVY